MFTDATDAADADDRSLRKAIKLHRKEWRIRRDDHNDGARSATGIIGLRCSADLGLPWKWVVLGREWPAGGAQHLPLQREPVATAMVRLNEHPNGVPAKFCGESATRCAVAALKAVADHAGTATLIAARHWRTVR